MNRKKLFVSLIFVALTISILATTVPVSGQPGLPGQGPAPSIFPTITITLLNGQNFSLTSTIWGQEVMPSLYSSQVAKYNWSSSKEVNYVFFDKSLKGLNPFGAQFVFALEKFNNVTLVTITKALVEVRNLPSVNSGYTNGQCLDLGILPGIPSSLPQQQGLINSSYYPAIVIASFIALIVILHFVFKKI